MAAVKPSTPAVFPGDPLSSTAPVDPAHMLKLLELELAQKRAARLAHESGSGPRTLPALSILFLLILLAAAGFAVWRVQTLRDARRPLPRASSPAPAADSAARPR